MFITQAHVRRAKKCRVNLEFLGRVRSPVPPQASNRHRYYVCWSRTRYGARTCDGERLPADQLDQAVTDSLLALYGDHALIDRAVETAKERVAKSDGTTAREIDGMDAKIAKLERSVERYLRAFEAGTMPETVCGQRLNELGEQIVLLRAHREELAEARDAEQPESLTPDQLAALHKLAQQTFARGSLSKRRALLSHLVHEVRVQGRDHIQPVFRVPDTSDLAPAPARVRAHIGLLLPVDLTGLEPVTPCMPCKCSTRLSYRPW